MPKRRVKRHHVTQPLNEPYRFIPLTQGQNAIVDATDFEWLNQWNWSALKSETGHFYAHRWSGARHISMHRLILGLYGKQMGDHENGNSLDNRRNNLRKCNPSQNVCNRVRRSDSSNPYKGIGPCNSGWRAYITKSGKRKHIGCFATAEEAAIAYNHVAKEMFGEFARLNQIVPPKPEP